MKNIDKVRKMSAEGIIALFCPSECPPEGNGAGGECDEMLCDGCWIAWLNQEAEVEE